MSETDLLLRVSENLSFLLASSLDTSVSESGQVFWTIGSRATFLVDFLAEDRPATKLESTAPLIQVAEYISEPAGQELRQRNCCYADAAGNAWIWHPCAEVEVLVQGRPRPKRPALAVQSAFRIHGIRLLFFLLSDAECLALPVQRLAEKAAIPVALVKTILADLESQGFLLNTSPRRLLARPELLERWVAAYNTQLRPRLNGQRYRFQTPQASAPDSLLARPAWAQAGAWGGEAAARTLLGLPGTPATLLLYTKADRTELRTRLELVPHKQGPLELLNFFAPEPPLAPTHPTCVHPLLVYADLRRDEDEHRQHLAQQLYHHYLKG